jgi:hypothetical protein
MHGDFLKYLPSSDDVTQQLNARVPTELVERVRVLAKIEKDSIANLVTEGIARVIEDRTANPNTSPEILARLAERRASLAIEMATIDSMLNSSTPQV